MDNSLKSFIRRKIEQLDREEDSYSKAACAKLRRAVGKHPGECPDIWDITLQGAPKGKKLERSYIQLLRCTHYIDKAKARA